MGTPAPRPLPARCPPGLVDEAETRLGFRLPDLLRRVLTEIADGGFGPGCGIVGIAGWAESGAHLVEQYEGFCEPVPDQPEADWPTALVPLAHLGCGMYDCVDAATPGHPVVTYDAPALDDGDSLHQALTPAAPTLERWLEDWVASPSPAERERTSLAAAAEQAWTEEPGDELGRMRREWLREQGLAPPDA